MTIYGRPWSEATLIKLASGYESVTHHRRDYATAQHQQTKIAKPIAFDADVALQVIDAFYRFGSGQIVLAPNQTQATAL